MGKTEDVTVGEEYLQSLQRAIPELIEESAELKFDQRNRVDLWLVLLYASILELANSACRLISIGEPTGSRTLARMVLEAYVDLTNLDSDDEYANFLDCGSLMEWQKTFKMAQQGNPYFKPLCDVPGFEDEVASEAERLAEFRSKGYRKLQTYERFKMADRESDYHGLYHWLCSDTHNSLRGLSTRHIEIINGNDFKIRILKETTFDQEIPAISVLLECLASSSTIIHGRYGRGLDAVADFGREVQKLREKY